MTSEIELYAVQRGIEALQEKYAVLLQKMNELLETREALESLAGVDPDSAAWIPLGSGNFVAGKVTDPETVLVGLGGGAAAVKTREEALKIVERRISELEAEMNRTVSDIHRLTSELRRLQAEYSGESRAVDSEEKAEAGN